MAKFIANLARIIMLGSFKWESFRNGGYFDGLWIKTEQTKKGYTVWVRLGVKGLPERPIIRYEEGNLTLASTINI